ncbi:hypothetical protein TcBrA4_0038560 [Trypanosoma cruzi]|nr:hypothetical protein TcBrA4_0038560 [Trypanosoma cruzi]
MRAYVEHVFEARCGLALVWRCSLLRGALRPAVPVGRLCALVRLGREGREEAAQRPTGAGRALAVGPVPPVCLWRAHLAAAAALPPTLAASLALLATVSAASLPLPLSAVARGGRVLPAAPPPRPLHPHRPGSGCAAGWLTGLRVLAWLRAPRGRGVSDCRLPLPHSLRSFFLSLSLSHNSDHGETETADA